MTFLFLRGKVLAVTELCSCVHFFSALGIVRGTRNGAGSVKGKMMCKRQSLRIPVQFKRGKNSALGG